MTSFKVGDMIRSANLPSTMGVIIAVGRMTQTGAKAYRVRLPNNQGEYVIFATEARLIRSRRDKERILGRTLTPRYRRTLLQWQNGRWIVKQEEWETESVCRQTDGERFVADSIYHKYVVDWDSAELG